MGPVKKGGQWFCEHVDDHVESWEVDETDLAVLDALQNEVDMEQNMSKALGCPSDLRADGDHPFIVEVLWSWCVEIELEGVGNGD